MAPMHGELVVSNDMDTENIELQSPVGGRSIGERLSPTTAMMSTGRSGMDLMVVA